MSNQISQSTSQCRDDIQCAKALAMILIVWGHLAGATEFTDTFKVFNPIFLARVPIWVFVAGYFNAAKSVLNKRSFVEKKVESLIIPLYAFTFLYAVIVLVGHCFGVQIGQVSLYSVLIDHLLGGMSCPTTLRCGSLPLCSYAK